MADKIEFIPCVRIEERVVVKQMYDNDFNTLLDLQAKQLNDAKAKNKDLKIRLKLAEDTIQELKDKGII